MKKNTYINIAGDVIINSNTILGVFDIDKTTVFKVNRNYLANEEKNGNILSVVDDIPKSYIVCFDKEKNSNKVYLSPLLPNTILKRNSFLKNKLRGENY